MILPLTTSLVLVCLSPQITDGDTLRCQGERVRLFGLDAPELDQPGGLLARDQLRRLTEGRTVRCVVENPAKPKDYFGRYVSICYTGQVDLAREMIRMGPSVEYTKYSKGRYSK